VPDTGVRGRKEGISELSRMSELDIRKGRENSLYVTWDDGDGVEDDDDFSCRFRIAMWKAMYPGVEGTDLGGKVGPKGVRRYDVTALLQLLRDHWRKSNMSVELNYLKRWGNYTRAKGQDLFDYANKMQKFSEEANAHGCNITEEQILTRVLFEADEYPALRAKADKYYKRLKLWKTNGMLSYDKNKVVLEDVLDEFIV